MAQSEYDKQDSSQALFTWFYAIAKRLNTEENGSAPSHFRGILDLFRYCYNLDFVLLYQSAVV